MALPEFVFLRKVLNRKKASYLPDFVSMGKILKEDKFRPLREELVGIAITGNEVARNDLRLLLDLLIQKAIAKKLYNSLSGSGDFIKNETLFLVERFWNEKMKKIEKKIYAGEIKRGKTFSYVYNSASNFTVEWLRKKPFRTISYEWNAEDEDAIARLQSLNGKKPEGWERLINQEKKKLFEYIEKRISDFINYTRIEEKTVMPLYLRQALSTYIYKQVEPTYVRPTSMDCAEELSGILNEVITPKRFDVFLCRARQTVKKAILNLENGKTEDYREKHKKLYIYTDSRGEKLITKDSKIASALDIFYKGYGNAKKKRKR